jgi:putative ABC transport system substrate-binding protein
MRRRDFLSVVGGGAVAAWPGAAQAQQTAIPVIGFLGSTSPGPYVALVAAFRQGLKETGYVEGQNVAIEFRWADGQLDRLPALAADLVRRKVDVIVTSGSVPPAVAAKAATSTIPIVFHIGADPVAVGLVASLNRPGGNVTGVSFLTYVAAPKRLGLLRDLIPALNVLGLLTDANDPVAESVVTELTAAVRSFGITLHVERAASERELDRAFAALAQRKVGAVIVITDPFIRTKMTKVVALAARYAIPDMYSGRDYAAAGGLVGYGANIGDAYRQQGNYAGKILKGEKPADLPVMQSTKFELVINLKTAKALGLALPSGMLSIADEVIE